MIQSVVRETHGRPKAIVVDNGPEFAGRALEAWAYQHQVEIRFIRPGKPIEDAYVESFNGKFRDECLNEHWLLSVAEARTIIGSVAAGLQHRAAAWLPGATDAGRLRRRLRALPAG